MASITREEYEYFKNKDPKTLTQEEHNWINEYESEAAGAPSKEEITWATHILNEKDPRVQAVYRQNGDFKKATETLNKQRSARSLMLNEGKSPWVHQVAKVPDDIAKGYGFQFNWKDAYEKENDAKLRATEADAEKLQKFIASKMYDVDDDVNLQKIAYNMHLWNPNTSDWSEFIQSENGDNFKKYIKDVEKYQKDKALDKIWGEDSNMFVDFMLPVTKEYARNNYDKINGLGDIAGPLALDAAANLVMTGTGTKQLSAYPRLSTIYGSVAAPAITEAGQVAFNDKPIPQAAIGTLEGTLVNAGTPMALNRGGNYIERWLGGAPERIQSTLNNAASKAREVAKRKKDGWIWYQDGKVMKMVKGVETEVQPTAADLKKVIPSEDLVQAGMGDRVRLTGTSSRGKTANKLIAAKASSDQEGFRRDLIKKIAMNENPTLEEVQLAGFNTRESFMNWLGDQIPNSFKNYMTNVGGRAKFGQRGVGSLINVYAPDVKLFKEKKEQEKGTDKWYRYYGLK
jgi:hypothetical protein